MPFEAKDFKTCPRGLHLCCKCQNIAIKLLLKNDFDNSTDLEILSVFFFFCLIWLSGCSVLLSPPRFGWFEGRSEASSFDFFQCFELKKKQFFNTLFELPVMSCFKGSFWSRMLIIVSSGSLDVEMYFGWYPDTSPKRHQS